ncbi:MAG: phosphoglucosamine mutase [Candidatus Saganbacteria bacterium]|nr:phosphoglucosamine mutase [Candidatus Saganbacteria bacterium]
MKDLKISVSGVRGIVGESLTPEIALSFAKAFGTHLNHPGRIVVGSDTRASSPLLKHAVISGLIATGYEVIDLGICPTPTVGIMIKELEAEGGVVITASHNPSQWNGLKFMGNQGIFLNEKEGKAFLEIYKDKAFKDLDPKKLKDLKTRTNAIAIHIAKVLKQVNVPLIKKSKFKVAVDACNGAGSVALPKLLVKLGCEVIELYTNPLEPFPRVPEPTPAHLHVLADLVKKKHADIGFALDPDADRLAIISEEGIAISEELTLALATDFILSSYKNISPSKKIVVTNLSTSRVMDDVAKKNRGVLIRTKIGEVHVAEEIQHLKALIGGEGNGGVIFPRVCFNRDSLSAAALILNLLAKENLPISKIVAALPSYYIVKKKITCHTQEEAFEVLDRAEDFFSGEVLDLTEGIKVLLKNAWIHIRASNTEPIVRVIAEAKTKKEAEELADGFIESLKL